MTLQFGNDHHAWPKSNLEHFHSTHCKKKEKAQN